MKNITVFCGASLGESTTYREQAHALGRELARREITLIFGGGKIGMMGAVADATLLAKGKVTGVIPAFLRTKEVAHEGLTEMHVVKTMHERKMLMHELGDGVIALAGGFGTLEELFEMLTWAQLGLHPKPIALLNTNGYFDHLLAFMDHMVKEGFLSESNRAMVLVHDDIPTLLTMMESYTAPDIPHWINREEV
jgi:uncharacterized protein (TIGR00730 family)